MYFFMGILRVKNMHVVKSVTYIQQGLEPIMHPVYITGLSYSRATTKSSFTIIIIYFMLFVSLLLQLFYFWQECPLSINEAFLASLLKE